MDELAARQATVAEDRAAAQEQPHHPPDVNPLSERERDVARLLVTGAGNAEIARDLVISPHTVKVHLRNIFEKLQVNSRTEATLVLLQQGWVTLPGVAPLPRVEEPAVIPAPPPLGDLDAPPRPWQWAIVAGILLLCVVALLLPVRGQPPKSPVALLSDGGQMAMGQPVVESVTRWTALPPLPDPRSRLAAVQIGGTIFVAGGEDEAGMALADFLVFDVGGERWRRGPAMPAARANLAMVRGENHLLVAGGSRVDWDAAPTLHIYADLLRYDMTREVWEAAGELPGPRAGAGLILMGDTVYLVGGWDGTALDDMVWAAPLDRLLQGDVAPDDWEPVVQLASGRAFMGLASLDGELVIAGGYDGRQELADVVALDVDGRQIRALPSLTSPRSGLRLLHDGISILAVGGGWTRAIPGHERLEIAAGQWVAVPSPIRGEWRHFAATTDSGNVYLIGGWSGDYLATTHRFQSTFRALLPAIPNLGED